LGNAQNSFNNSCIFIICHKLCFCLRTLHSAKGNPEREAILNALREKLKEFPDKEPSSINFEYKRKDVGVAKWFIEEGKKIIFIVNYLKVKDNWAWIEVSGANYSIDIDSLLYKEKGKLMVKGLVRPSYVVCLDKECVDVKLTYTKDLWRNFLRHLLIYFLK